MFLARAGGLCGARAASRCVLQTRPLTLDQELALSRAITAEDVYRWKWVSDPQISPGGSKIAYVVKTIDQEAGEYRHAIWVVPTDGQIGDARRFTYGPKNDHSPRWSPDGQWLAFISDREGEGGKDAKEDKARGKGKPQVWKIPADGGEAQQ